MGNNVYIVTRYKRTGELGAVIRSADPRCFAMVMATGTASVALRLPAAASVLAARLAGYGPACGPR